MINIFTPRYTSPGSAIATLQCQFRRAKTPVVSADDSAMTWGQKKGHSVISGIDTLTAQSCWCDKLDKLVARVIPGYPTEPDDGAVSWQVFFDQLIEDIDPHRQPSHRPGWQARILAGRWLALRRARLGLAYAQLTQSTGITPSALLLLETGLANETSAPVPSWDLLIAALDGSVPMAAPVAAVVAIALGRVDADRPPILAQIVDDLRPTIMGGRDHQTPPILPISTISVTRDHTPRRSLPTPVAPAEQLWVVHGIYVVLMVLLALTMFLGAQVQLRQRGFPPPIGLQPRYFDDMLCMHIPFPTAAVPLTDQRNGAPSFDLLPSSIEEIISAQHRHKRLSPGTPALFCEESDHVPRRTQWESFLHQPSAPAERVPIFKQPDWSPKASSRDIAATGT